MNMIPDDYKLIIMSALGGVVTALLTGKFVRRLLLLPFEYLAKRSENKIDDKLVSEAQKDLGIDKPTLPDEDK